MLHNNQQDIQAAGEDAKIEDLISGDKAERYDANEFNPELGEELKKDLKNLGYKFSTDTDTEVLLNAWIEWGEVCLKKLVGMFAFVVFDKEQKKLFCARDAFGIKPFFYSLENGEFNFSSEINALVKLLPETPKINSQTSFNYLIHGIYDNQEFSFFNGMQ